MNETDDLPFPDFSPPRRTSPCQLYLISPLEVGGGFADRLKAALDGGPVAILLIVFLGGLALNLTPCVLPMIPINLAIIGAGTQAGSRARGFLLGAAYGAAMALVYGALGVIVILTAGTFGTINASPWFNAAIAVLFIALALAMFDVITIDFSTYSYGLIPKAARSAGVATKTGPDQERPAAACCSEAPAWSSSMTLLEPRALAMFWATAAWACGVLAVPDGLDPPGPPPGPPLPGPPPGPPPPGPPGRDPG